jgi:hypothetical protein
MIRYVRFCSKKLLLSSLLVFGIIGLSADGRPACVGQAPPADNLFLISVQSLRSLALPEGEVDLIHDYGASRLVRVPDALRLPPEALRAFAPVEKMPRASGLDAVDASAGAFWGIGEFSRPFPKRPFSGIMALPCFPARG